MSAHEQVQVGTSWVSFSGAPATILGVEYIGDEWHVWARVDWLTKRQGYVVHDLRTFLAEFTPEVRP